MPEELLIVETPEGVEIIELVDVEFYISAGKELPHGKKYKIRVDKRHFETEKSELKGREILAKVDKKPTEWFLYEHRHKETPTLIGPDQIVDLHHHKVERFTTMANDTTEGEK